MINHRLGCIRKDLYSYERKMTHNPLCLGSVGREVHRGDYCIEIIRLTLTLFSNVPMTGT